MNFVGIGPQELVVILVIALIFVGPQRLPKLAADLARMIREIRQYTGGIAAEFSEAIKEFEKDTEPERTQWKEIGQGLGDASQTAADVAKQVKLSPGAIYVAKSRVLARLKAEVQTLQSQED